MTQPHKTTQTRFEREHFLAEPRTAALSVSLGVSRGPLTVPIWYDYIPGGEPWVLVGAATRKARLIQEAGFFSLMVQRLEPTRRYVAVEGAVSGIHPATDDHIVEITRRHLNGAAADRHIDFLRKLGENLVISMRPQHWLYSDEEAF